MIAGKFTGKFIVWSLPHSRKPIHHVSAVVHENDTAYIVDYGPRFTGGTLVVNKSLSSRILNLKTVMG